MIPRDPYHTVPGTKRFWLDKLLPGWLLSFRIRFLIITFDARRKCQRKVYTDEEWIQSSDRMLHLFEGCGGRFHITGMENIRKCRKPAIFVSNHMSTLETMVFPGLIAPVTRVTFVVKEPLVKSWIFGPVMRSRNPIVVSRENSRNDLNEVLTKGHQLLKEGISIVIFPQHTRRSDFVPAEFNSLAVKLAAREKVPVVPVAIKTDFWKNGKHVRELGGLERSRPIYMHFGEPMEIAGNGKEENQQIIRFISEHLQAWFSLPGSRS